MSDTTSRTLNRRGVLAGLAGAGVLALGTGTGIAGATPGTAGGPRRNGRESLIPAQTSWDPVPAMTGGPTTVSVRGAVLEVWDTGGTGVPIVLQHPHSGHGGVWGYQQAAFAEAGHRVISYSRRGYGTSTGFVRDP